MPAPRTSEATSRLRAELIGHARTILRTLGVSWDLRAEYFPGVRKVRPKRAEEMRTTA